MYESQFKEIVKCRKCKYTEKRACPITGTEQLICMYYMRDFAVDPSHYCGYGERKDVDEE